MMVKFDSAGLRAGIWEGTLTGDRPGRVALTLHGAIVALPTLQDLGGGWRMRVPIPPETLASGVQTYFLIADDGTGTEPPRAGGVRLARLALLAGEALDDDVYAEIDLLRAELDLLKREIRSLATGGGAAD